MKKLFFMTLVTIFMVMVSCETMAQSNLKVPKVIKFVYVKDGVNIRKAPSIQSPRFVIKSTDDRYIYKWEEPSDDKSKIKPVTYRNSRFLPVIGETSEWYHVLWGGQYPYGINYEKITLAYVSKKVCKVYQKRAIDESYIMGRDHRQNQKPGIQGYYDDNEFYIRTTGKYKNYCIIHGWLQGPFSLQTYIGKLVDGVLVGYDVKDAMHELGFPALADLPDRQIDKILEYDNAKNNPCYVYGLPGSAEAREGLIPGEGIFTLYLDIDNYEGPTY
ncbi:MAG: hypothetical protein J1E57_07595 [Prevotella sp.]|nr:hypothetical protein [Prevotella sp.]